MLLTSSQVSVAISSGIVVLFTLILFLSGYVIQQRTVHSLQAAIKPRLPKPLPAPNQLPRPALDVKWARPVGSRPDDEHVQQFEYEQNLDWNRLGYVQVVRDKVELCSAVMLLGDLQRLRSPAKRILLFPKAWLRDREEKGWDPELDTTHRLLRTAALRFAVVLMPMGTLVEGADESLPSSYSLASIYSLVEYERIIHLQGPGLLLDASALDSLLAFSKSAPMAAYPATPERKDMSTSLLLIHPSVETYRQLRELRSSQPMSDLELFRTTFSFPDSLISKWSLSMGNVVYESPSLRNAIDGFNATVFEQATTYVRLSDPEIPGPEYDVPYYKTAAIRPSNQEARTVWEGLYENFRQRRMEICALDLEVWTRPGLQAETGDESVEL